jgi:hypothetical protein
MGWIGDCWFMMAARTCFRARGTAVVGSAPEKAETLMVGQRTDTGPDGPPIRAALARFTVAVPRQGRGNAVPGPRTGASITPQAAVARVRPRVGWGPIPRSRERHDRPFRHRPSPVDLLRPICPADQLGEILPRLGGGSGRLPRRLGCLAGTPAGRRRRAGTASGQNQQGRSTKKWILDWPLGGRLHRRRPGFLDQQCQQRGRRAKHRRLPTEVVAAATFGLVGQPE